MSTAYSDFVDLHATVDAEERQRNDIRYSDPFVSLNIQIQALQGEQEEMLKVVPDHSADLEIAKGRMMDFLAEAHLSHFQNVAAKYREKKEVNKKRVLDVLQGDLDRFYELAQITQVALKSAAKDDPLLKHDLLDCIETIENTIVDLEVVLPQSA